MNFILNLNLRAVICTAVVTSMSALSLFEAQPLFGDIGTIIVIMIGGFTVYQISDFVL